MMKPQFRILYIVIAALMFSGCAGLSANKTQAVTYPLRGMVPESFHFNLQDPATRGYLAAADLDSLAPDQRLEVLVLRELARVSEEKELIKAFDRLWDEQNIVKKLVHQPEQRKNLIYPLVEIYYLLSAGSAPFWQEETAERLFQETLKHVEPFELSGYALHFYTLALLKNGKFEASLPFLRRLEHFTTDQIYLRDLTVALNHIIDSGAYQLACQLMVIICQKGAKQNIEFPEDNLKFAITTLQKAGKSELVREALLPVVRKNPRLHKYSFAQLLDRNRETVGEEWQVKEQVAGIREKGRQASEITTENRQLVSSGLREAQNKVRVEVQVIKADQRSSYIDPALAAIGESLRKTLNFSSFTLIGGKILRLGVGEEGGMALTRANYLRIIPRSLTPEISRIEVSVLAGEREVFHTLVESVDGGTTTIGGPQTGDNGVLLLRITTFIMKMKTDAQYPCNLDKIPKKSI